MAFQAKWHVQRTKQSLVIDLPMVWTNAVVGLPALVFSLRESERGYPLPRSPSVERCPDETKLVAEPALLRLGETRI